jgi:hypothetical protein
MATRPTGQSGTPAPPGALYTNTVDHAERPVAVHPCSGDPPRELSMHNGS